MVALKTTVSAPAKPLFDEGLQNKSVKANRRDTIDRVPTIGGLFRKRSSNSARDNR
jgi:hypothetical protein